MSKNFLLIAAGGTGGHMFPAQALSDLMLSRGWRVKLSTDLRGMSFAGEFSPLVSMEVTNSGAFSGVGLSRKLFVPFKIISGIISILKSFKKDRPDIVIGFGGYPTIPPLLVAKFLKIPIILHEQNGVLGLVNKMFSKYANAVASGTLSTKLPDGVKENFTGNPVRPAIIQRAGSPYIPPGDYPMSILVIGGSQGAKILSEIVPQSLGALPKSILKQIRVIHQARDQDKIAVLAAYESLNIPAVVKPFFTDIGNKIAEAQLIISRAGASSVADISIVGRPSILVPFAAATNDHQTVNAASSAELGASVVISEAELTIPGLSKVVESILSDSFLANKMAKAALKVGNPDSSYKLMELVEEVSGGVQI
ncbi:MAG: UDP-N-acetylglucosamine--N-acetylmuramyl-(pentapeptide) pyrophosphoryl-undecaprenol N-acetylglucosamine transferase [Proteobacteria bacterium]|nr:UDP-N-acetylglucosamine--N-acetylmuramyl-(pentapeptide) pyrophosphoryl-undecaprenol N-acetylglucosamine transferase [Pseudomonadota bacterium]